MIEGQYEQPLIQPFECTNVGPTPIFTEEYEREMISPWSKKIVKVNDNKKERKKLRNRVYAQQSRDRKKQEFDLIKYENEGLKQENNSLRSELQEAKNEIERLQEIITKLNESKAKEKAKKTLAKKVDSKKSHSKCPFLLRMVFLSWLFFSAFVSMLRGNNQLIPNIAKVKMFNQEMSQSYFNEQPKELILEPIRRSPETIPSIKEESILIQEKAIAEEYKDCIEPEYAQLLELKDNSLMVDEPDDFFKEDIDFKLSEDCSIEFSGYDKMLYEL